jgi:hypothetical protein
MAPEGFCAFRRTTRARQDFPAPLGKSHAMTQKDNY